MNFQYKFFLIFVRLQNEFLNLQEFVLINGVRSSKLKLSFYRRDTKTVAMELLGKKLVRIYKGQRISGIITEVEAYLGVKDKAAHSYGDRRTGRTEIMYGDGGHSYIYFIYGMYHCFNVVTQREGTPEAVLVRALEPVEGIELMKKFRQKENLKELTTGPGKLAEALHLTRDLNGERLDSKVLFIEDAEAVSKNQIVKRPRIGVDYAGAHALHPLRYYLKNNIYISKL
jgi:DNA-3-methyladenine glycosylase